MSTLALATRIEDAETTTAAIADLVAGASEKLDRTFPAVTNEFGVYADPARVHATLIEAKAAIDAAVNAVLATDWPRKSDYQEAADGHD